MPAREPGATTSESQQNAEAQRLTELGRHADLEQQVLEHVRRLLTDDRLRLDTRLGNRPVTAFRQHIAEADELAALGQELAGLRAELLRAGAAGGRIDPACPRATTWDIALQRRRWLVLAETIGRLYLRVLAPIVALARGEAARPVTGVETQKAMASAPRVAGVPTTFLLASTSGFAPEARELAERRSDRTVVLLEPNGAGGWRVWAPAETRGIMELFDPEAEADKRRRVRQFVLARELELGGSGLSADKVASATMLPTQLVEAELRLLAKETPGWMARRLDGRLVVFRSGAALSPVTGSREPAILDRVRALLERKGEHEKKIAYLSDRRAALGQQRDRVFERLSGLEADETELKSRYQAATDAEEKQEIAGQLLQSRRQAERLRRMLTLLNQQVAVLGTHLHNLELARTGTATGLPTSEQIAEDAARAEQVLAELQASGGLADPAEAPAESPEQQAELMAELDAELRDELRAETPAPPGHAGGRESAADPGAPAPGPRATDR